eukprot:2830383-Pleurochrysis_carterae.AAC.1
MKLRCSSLDICAIAAETEAATRGMRCANVYDSTLSPTPVTTSLKYARVCWPRMDPGWFNRPTMCAK